MTAQYARPASDITSTNVASGTYADIDEETPSDADYLYGTNNTAVTYETKLSSVTDPSSNTGHTISYRIAKTKVGTVDAAGSVTTVTAYLYQGSTLIATDDTKTLGDWTTISDFTLSSAEADAITDYTDLRIRFYSPASGGAVANRRSVGLSWAQLEVPEAVASDDLVSKDVASGVPTADKPTIGQVHVLVPKGVITEASMVDKSTIGQVHVLVSTNIATPAPTVDKPTLGVSVPSDDLVSTDIVSGVPSVDKPTLEVISNIIVVDISTGIPTVDKATIAQVHALVSTDISSGVPAVDKPEVVDVPHATVDLVSKDIISGAPVIDKPTLAEAVAGVDDLVAKDIAAGVPIVDKPTLAEVAVSTKRNYGRSINWMENYLLEEEEAVLLAVMELI
jgi:hypothetical protein